MREKMPKAEDFEKAIEHATKKGFKEFERFIEELEETYVYHFALMYKEKPDFLMLIQSVLDLKDNTENLDVVFVPKRFMDAFFLADLTNMYCKRNMYRKRAKSRS